MNIDIEFIKENIKVYIDNGNVIYNCFGYKFCIACSEKYLNLYLNDKRYYNLFLYQYTFELKTNGSLQTEYLNNYRLKKLNEIFYEK